MKNYFTLLVILFLVSCKTSTQKEEKSLELSPKKEISEVKKTEVNKPSREEDIKLVEAYLSNSKRSLTDDEGFPLNYEVNSIWGRKKSLGKSKEISNKGKYRNSLYLQLSIQELTLVLKLNGEEKRRVKFLAQIYDYYILNPAGSDKIPSKYTKQRKIFVSELDNEETLKEIIKFVTTPDFSQAMFEQNDNDKKVSNQWIRISSNLIKESGIKKYKSIKDF
ncbi:hypothetical protein [Tenacibaculum agarivorans]|uniref:hypothetical protein n=1 Tax=Tenacibaculum agarivorans TaxID=1908389 RepID=UPI00094BC1D1|nr:hypothetical protein [Tenacibaculum agarivorans]